MSRVLARDDYRLQVGAPSIFSLFNWRLVLSLIANFAVWGGIAAFLWSKF